MLADAFIPRLSEGRLSLRINADSEVGVVTVTDTRGELLKLLEGAGESSGYRLKDKENQVDAFISALQTESSSTVDMASTLEGEWDLLYTNDDPTRSSPFFHAFRKALADVPDPLSILTPSLSESVFAITDSIPIKSVGTVKQYFSKEEDNIIKLKSEVRVKVDPVGSSLMTTTSKVYLNEDDKELELQVQKTEVLDSTVSRFIPFLDNIQEKFGGFPSGASLELARPGSSTIYMSILYLDAVLRIIKYSSSPDKVFIYKKAD